jgi:Fuc2NAc and GlcNAc transferase
MSLWILLPALAGFSAFLTWVLRRYALHRNLLDVPNERSSHRRPTPRGGGVAIALVYLAVLPMLGFYGWLPWPMVIGLWGAGAVVGVVGFLDDHRHVAVRWRLLAHFAAAFWLLIWLPSLPQLSLFGNVYQLGWAGYLLGALLLVWLLNLFNFMDGIDALASVEAITTCVGAALLYALATHTYFAAAPLLLAAAVAGFLVWNAPPARIFMGDSGSGFLGIVLGGLAFQAAWVAPQLLWGWLILLGVFIVDATVTLLHRALRLERVHEAHRNHAYQHATRAYDNPLLVTLAVLAINVLWLLPWACLVTLNLIDGTLALIIAYVPLVALAIRFRAGAPERP